MFGLPVRVAQIFFVVMCWWKNSLSFTSNTEIVLPLRCFPVLLSYICPCLAKLSSYIALDD